MQKIDAIDRRTIAQSLAATWRGHSTSGIRPNPGFFEISEDEEKLTFTMNPHEYRQAAECATAATGPTARVSPTPPTTGPSAATPPVLHPLRLHERAGADQLDRLPGLSVGATQDFERDPCIWHWYKDPADIPNHPHWERYGLERRRRRWKRRRRLTPSSPPASAPCSPARRDRRAGAEPDSRRRVQRDLADRRADARRFAERPEGLGLAGADGARSTHSFSRKQVYPGPRR